MFNQQALLLISSKFEKNKGRNSSDSDDDSYYNNSYDPDDNQDHVKENARNFSIFFDSKDEDLKNGNLFGADKEGIKIKFVYGKDIFAVRVNSNISYDNLINKEQNRFNLPKSNQLDINSESKLNHVISELNAELIKANIISRSQNVEDLFKVGM